MRICLVARAGLELVTFRSQSRRFPSTPHMSTNCDSITFNLYTRKVYLHDDFAYKELNANIAISKTSKLFESIILEIWKKHVIKSS